MPWFINMFGSTVDFRSTGKKPDVAELGGVKSIMESSRNEPSQLICCGVEVLVEGVAGSYSDEVDEKLPLVEGQDDDRV